MSAASRDWLRALRRGVRARRRALPGPRRQAARMRRRRWLGGLGGLVVGTGAALMITFGFAEEFLEDGFTDGFRLFLWSYLLLLASTIGVFLGAHRLGSDGDLLFHALQPADSRWVAGRQIRRAARDSWWVWILVGILFVRAGLRDSTPLAVIVGTVGLTAGAALLAVGITLWAAGRGGAWVYGALKALWWLGAGVFPLQILPAARDALVGFLNRHGDALSLLLPTSWLVRPWRAFLAGGPVSEALWLLPLGILALSLPSRWRAAVAAYRFRDAVLLQYAAQLPDDVDPEAAAEFERALRPGDSRERADLLAEVQEGGLPAGRLGGRGDRIERWIWRWWTPRERRLAEWALGDWPGLGRRYVWGLVCLGVAWGLGSVPARNAGAGVDWDGLPIVAWIFGGGVGALLLVPLGNALPRALAADVDGTIAFSRFPVGLGELHRLALKWTVVRMVVAMPAVLAYLGAMAWVAGFPVVTTLGMGVRGMIALVLLRPVLLSLELANGLPYPRGWFGVAMAVVMLPALLLIIGLGVVSVPATPGWFALPFLGALGAGFSAMYAAAIGRRRVDLRKVPGG